MAPQRRSSKSAPAYPGPLKNSTYYRVQFAEPRLDIVWPAGRFETLQDAQRMAAKHSLGGGWAAVIEVTCSERVIHSIPDRSPPAVGVPIEQLEATKPEAGRYVRRRGWEPMP